MTKGKMSSPSLLDAYSIEKVCRAEQISWHAFLVVTFFGIGSWIAINGVFIELPVIVNHAPEGWKLPSYLIVICQLANIGPLVYSIGRRYYPKAFHERPAIYAMLAIGIASCVCLAQFWNHTSHVLGQQRSTGLLAFAFCVALVDCTSTLTFLPFMAILPELYMSPLYIGENLSGLIPSLLALIQGSQEDQQNNMTLSFASSKANSLRSVNGTSEDKLRFSQGVFFALLAVMMLVSLVSFAVINLVPSLKALHVRAYSTICKDFRSEGRSRESLLHSDVGQALHSCSYREGKSCCSTEEDDDAGNLYMSFMKVMLILAIQLWINFLSNGVLSGIQAFACGPYGAMAYHLGGLFMSWYYLLCYVTVKDSNRC